MNFRLWHDKHLIVYGSYKSCNKLTTDWKPKTQLSGASAPVIDGQGYYYNKAADSYGEYRYHGFASTGDKFTNADFPADAYLGKEASKDWIIYPWESDKVVPAINQSPYSYSANSGNNTTTQQNTKVLEYYLITSYQWEYNTVSGEQASMKMTGSSNDLLKEFLYKESGTYSITLQAVNTLGRVSDPYTVQFVIAPDVPPAIEICLDNSVLARNETISAYHYFVSSTDGDIIKSNTIELWYDSNNDGNYDQLINTWDGTNGFPAYFPTNLGKYKYIDRVSEDFGQNTLSEFIVPEDKMVKVQGVEFLVDNYVPMTDLYVDIPVVRPQVDMFIMDDCKPGQD